MGTRKDFVKHLTLFIIAHILINVLIRMESSPQFFSGIKQSIQEGKIWVYHEETGIFITIIWLIILTGQGFYVLLFIDKTQQKE